MAFSGGGKEVWRSGWESWEDDGLRRLDEDSRVEEVRFLEGRVVCAGLGGEMADGEAALGGEAMMLVDLGEDPIAW